MELGLAAEDVAVEVDQQRQQAPLALASGVGAVAVPAEVLLGLVAVVAEALVEADDLVGAERDPLSDLR